jgi:hypothetical protein
MRYFTIVVFLAVVSTANCVSDKPDTPLDSFTPPRKGPIVPCNPLSGECVHQHDEPCNSVSGACVHQDGSPVADGVCSEQRGYKPQACPSHLGSWSPWYDRDDPSGSGDWETLTDLRKQHPDLCDQPRTLDGRVRVSHVDAQLSGEDLSLSSPTVGLVCRNADQTDGRCLDYEVRFCCPHQGCRSQDNNPEQCVKTSCPGSDNPDQRCQYVKNAPFDQATLGKPPPSNLVLVPSKGRCVCPCAQSDECKKRGGTCRSSCPDAADCLPDACSGPDCTCLLPPPPAQCEDFHGDADVCAQNTCPLTGRPCVYTGDTCNCSPAKDSCRLASTAEECKIANCVDDIQSCQWDSTTGTCGCPLPPPLACTDIQHPGRCQATTCPGSTDGTKCHYSHRLRSCGCPEPSAPCSCADVPWDKCDRTQCPDDPNRKCSNVKGDLANPVSRCECTPEPPQCTHWTNWFDRDDPSATGDWEDVGNLRTQNPGRICQAPSQIQGRVVGSHEAALSTGQTLAFFGPATGLACVNSQQPTGADMCLDYEVRFCCDKAIFVAQVKGAVCMGTV